MKEIKLIVDGKEVKLTEEQTKIIVDYTVKQFERIDGEFWYIDDRGFLLPRNDNIEDIIHEYSTYAKQLYRVGNYCRNKKIMEKRAKQEILNRLLWRFSMENGWDDSLWDDRTISKYRVNYDLETRKYFVDFYFTFRVPGAIYYVSKEIAQRAIDEIIIPFEKGKLEVCKIWEE